MATSSKAASKRAPERRSARQKKSPAPDDGGIQILTYVDKVESDLDIEEDQFLSPEQRPSLIRRVFGTLPKIDTVSPETLQANLSRFLQAMQKTFTDAPVQLGHYRLDEIEIAVEVSAEGEVSLLGNGGKVGGKGTLTLKLKHMPE